MILTFTCLAAFLLIGNLETKLDSDSHNRAITVVVRYTGIEATELERLISRPLERALSHVYGIQTIRSATEPGRVRVTLTLRKDTSIDAAYGEIRDSVDYLYTQLPEAVQRPQLYRGDTTSPPLLVLALRSRGDREIDLRRAAENELRGEIERIPGVAEARVSGGSVQEIQIDISSPRLAVAQVPPSRLSARLNDRHSLMSGGVFHDERLTLPVVIDARLSHPNALEEVPLRSSNRQLDLSSVAEVHNRRRQPDTISRLDTIRRVLITVTPAADANLLETAELIRTQIVRWPNRHSVETDMVYNAAKAASARLIATATAVCVSVAAVLLVLWMGSRSAVRALHTALVLPVSILVTLGVFSVAGYAIDIGLLAGLAVASGLVVDSAILLTRNADIVPEVEGGSSKDPMPIKVTPSATLPAVFTSAVTTIAAFSPFLLFPELLIDAASIARAASVLVAVSVPCSLVIRSCRFSERSWYPSTDNPAPVWTHKATGILNRIVEGSARRPRSVIGVSALITCATAMLAYAAGSDSAPLFPGRTFRVHAEFEPGASASSVDRRTHALFAALDDHEAVERLETISRRDNASVAITLEEGHTWTSVAPIIERIDAGAHDVSIHTVSRTTGITPIEIAVTGPERRVTRTLAREIAGTLALDGRVTGVVLHFKQDPPALVFRPDRVGLANVGMTPGTFAETLRLALHGSIALKWQHDNGETDVRMRFDGQTEPSVDTLLAQPVSTPFGTIPVTAVSRLERTTRASRIDRYNRQRASLLTASYTTRSLERALHMFRRDMEDLAIPPGYAVSVDRDYYRRMQQYRVLWKSLVATTLAIVLIIATAGESLRPAFLCLLILPPTVACALLPFLVGGNPIPTPVIVGLVMLVGTAVNNGILIGLDAKSGDVCSSIMRRAPDLIMTTLTSVVAAVPLLSVGGLLSMGGATGITETMAQVLLFGSLASFLVTFVVMPAGGKLVTG